MFSIVWVTVVVVSLHNTWILRKRVWICVWYVCTCVCRYHTSVPKWEGKLSILDILCYHFLPSFLVRGSLTVMGGKLVIGKPQWSSLLCPSHNTRGERLRELFSAIYVTSGNLESDPIFTQQVFLTFEPYTYP